MLFEMNQNVWERKELKLDQLLYIVYNMTLQNVCLSKDQINITSCISFLIKDK